MRTVPDVGPVGRARMKNTVPAGQFICTLSECLGDDIREIREQLTEISMNCEAITYYRPAAND